MKMSKNIKIVLAGVILTVTLCALACTTDCCKMITDKLGCYSCCERNDKHQENNHKDIRKA